MAYGSRQDQDREDECWNRALRNNHPDWALAAALFSLADNLAYAARTLGTSDAATPMGALEAHAAHLGEKLDRVAEALESREAEPL